MPVTTQHNSPFHGDGANDDRDRGVEGIVGHMEDDFDLEDTATVVQSRGSSSIEGRGEVDLLGMQ